MSQPCLFSGCKNITLKTPFCEAHLRSECGVEVRKSTIPNAGNGLFSLVDRKRNQRIVTLEGERSYTKDIDFGGRYCLEYKDDHFIDCENSTTCCAGRYINDPRDSKQVNCKFIYDKQQDKVWVVSTKHIHPGQELFLSYGNHSYWSKLD